MKNGIRENHRKKRLAAWLAGAFMLAVCCMVFVRADIVPAEECIEIYTYEDLLAIADNPDADYVLMQDIDMSGVEWEPLDFSGSIDGNGHALLNVTVTSVTDDTMQTYDGNMKVYDTYFSGFFGILKNASVSNLKLINYGAQVESDVPCFAGSLAGYSEGSTITGCTVTADVRLDAHDRMFGVGGIVGYGNGTIESTSADVTLVCNDTDALNRDEQFLGGAYGAGYFDLNECHIDIDGYVSEHGYTHNGGVAGMYILYPAGTVYEGYLTNTRVTGKISFYEDNTDRRAYCKDFIGEVMNWTYQVAGNSSDFISDESHDYSVVLVPHTCAEPEYSTQQFEADCENYGYVLYHCNLCGYEYKDNYTAVRHDVAQWSTVKEADTENFGIEEGECTLCGAVVRRLTDKLEEETTTESEAVTTVEASESGTAGIEDSADSDDGIKDEESIGGILVTAVVIAAIAIVVVVIVKKRRRQH